MRLKRFFAFSIILCLALSLSACFLHRISGGPDIPILMYHHFVIDGNYNSMTVGPWRFKDDMDFLKSSGFTPLLPEDIKDIYNGKCAMPVRPVMIVFDDGYESNYEYAYPILKERGMYATITLIASNIRKEDTEPKNFLTWEQCREMRESGVIDIGSHTYNLHNPETGGDVKEGQPNGVQRKKEETQKEYLERVGTDLQKSFDLIEENTGKPAVLFSYPFGATDNWFFKLPKYSSIDVSVTTEFNLASIKKGLYGLPRLRVDMEKQLKDIEEIQPFLKKTAKAVPKSVKVNLNGEEINMQSYRINNDDYFKLRDIALLLNETPYSFSIEWAEEGNTTVITTGEKYINSSESSSESYEKVIVSPINNNIVIDEINKCITSFQINNNNYFRLYDISKVIGFTLEKENKIIT